MISLNAFLEPRRIDSRIKNLTLLCAIEVQSQHVLSCTIKAGDHSRREMDKTSLAPVKKLLGSGLDFLANVIRECRAIHDDENVEVTAPFMINQ